MKLSINEKIVNKNDANVNQAKGFNAVDISTEVLAEHVALGHAFSFQYIKSYRNSDNFICSDIVAADIDEGMTLEEAMNDPFIINNACLLYTTASHTEDDHRFRLVFELPHTVHDSEQIRYLLRGLIRKFSADPKNVDPARQFYGSTGCITHLFGKVLSEDNFEHLLKLGHEPLNTPDRQSNKSGKSGFRSTLTIDDDLDIRNAKGQWQRLSDLDRNSAVYCPFHNDKHPSAHIVISRSSNDKGIRCSTCQVSFWPTAKTPEPYDFYRFDKLVRKEVEDFIPSGFTDEREMVVYEAVDPNILVSQKYLPTLPIHNGITLVKSGKGTGKTQYLKHLVSECRKGKISVLLVGHRRSLLRALSSSLDLQCYLDVKEMGMFATNRISKHFAVSVDSMATMLNPNLNKFDVVLIDESEQVFSHLISETIDIKVRNKCYLLLQHFIHVAKSVVALDADLNEITLHAIQRFGNKNPFLDRRLVLNEYRVPQKPLEMYSSENQIIGEIFRSIDIGERIFICSNSKKCIDRLVEQIGAKYADAIPLFWVTRDNSGSQDVATFLEDIKNEILKYKVILVSPAMGTGIDITFDNDDSNVDGVYGLFESRINTHFDIDQQISRVRHPKFVRLWISPETFNYETEIDPIKQEIAESQIIPEVLTGYANTGLPDYNWNNPYLTLYATILSSQRASKNRLRQNLIELKTYNGWSVIEVDKDVEMIAEGSTHAKQGEALRKLTRIQRILSAIPIDGSQVDTLKRRSDSGKPLSENEKNSLERFWIENFYRQSVTESLIERDNEEKLRNQIVFLEGLLGSSKKEITSSEFVAKVKLLRELLEVTGVLKSNSEFDTSLTITTDTLKGFVTLCRKKKVKIERVFGVTLRKDLSSKPVSQLGQFLGFCGVKTVKENPLSTGDTKLYRYRIDSTGLDEILEIVRIRQTPQNTRQ